MRFKLPVVNLILLAIIAEGFFSRLSFGFISFALPLYAHQLGLSLTEIGFLTSLNLTVALLLKPVMGRAADRFGLKKALTAAIGLRSLVGLLLAFAAVPWQLYTVRTVHGMSMSLRDPAVNALIAEHGGKKSIASAFAWYSTAKSVAGACGKALAGILLTLTAANFSAVFLCAFVLSAVPLVVVGRWVQQSEESKGTTSSGQVSQGQDTTHTPIKPQTIQPKVIPFIGFGFLISSTAAMLHGLFPILATEYAGLTEAETGIIYMASTLIILGAGPLFGWLSDTVSRKLVLLTRGAANVCSSLIYLLAPNFPGIAAGKAVDDMGKAAFRPAWGALMAHVSGFDPSRRAQTMSLMSMGEDAGDILGPMLAGLLWNVWGVPVLLGVRMVLAIVTELYALALTRALPEPAPEPIVHGQDPDRHRAAAQLIGQSQSPDK